MKTIAETVIETEKTSMTHCILTIATHSELTSMRQLGLLNLFTFSDGSTISVRRDLSSVSVWTD